MRLVFAEEVRCIAGVAADCWPACEKGLEKGLEKGEASWLAKGVGRGAGAEPASGGGGGALFGLGAAAEPGGLAVGLRGGIPLKLLVCMLPKRGCGNIGLKPSGVGKASVLNMG